ncbi:hypothetical protein MRB53_031166 [Persea americana]|uniref:Uncharacterized protein n=1 Tax=Persea americana TaxID=3435 RepID=A0ACC2KPB8_PERAE|nr:hypothetical protein MRB53_031166 [Persea americana]
MDMKLVFQSLLEIFPQVDARILKAVSFEHSNDVDSAVESVLVEVLPNICSLEEVLLITGDNQVQYASISGVKIEESNSLLKHQLVGKETNAGPSPESSSVAHNNVPGTGHMSDPLCAKSTSLDEPCNGCSASGVYVENDHDRLSVDTALEELTSSTNHGEIVGLNHFSHEAPSLSYQDPIITRSYQNSVCSKIQESQREVSHCSVSAACGGDHRDHLCLDVSPLNQETTLQNFKCLLDEVNQDSLEHAAVDQMDLNSSVSKKCQERGAKGLLESDAEHLVIDNKVADVDESLLTTIATQSDQIVNIDFLEEFITDVKSNKKILVSAMESLCSMVKEVEIQEKAAEHAKKEALMGGLDVLSKVDDLRQMLQHAKKTNEMHAGEVYGEKSILATEAWELQSRILKLSDQGDGSLLIMDEMRQNLEARLAVADAERAAAERGKLDKEEFARRALAKQTVIKDKAVQESKNLQQAAEDNAKLRELLVDCGRTVDILHGEMAVICEDVKFLKERIAGHLPFSKSLVLSRMNGFGILASSSRLSCQVLEQSGSSEGLKETSCQGLSNSEPSENSTTNTVKENATHNYQLLASSDDEWEIFRP